MSVGTRHSFALQRISFDRFFVFFKGYGNIKTFAAPEVVAALDAYAVVTDTSAAAFVAAAVSIAA